MRFLNIKTDYAFKKVFGSENSKGILKSFLNSTLDLQSPIDDLKIVDPYNVPKLRGMKETAVDVKAILEDKTKVIIEMQILNHDGFESRILYNTAKNYANQLDRGIEYKLLNPVIALTIVNFKMFQFDKYKSLFALLEKENFSEYKDDIRLQFIELPKFKKTIEECNTIEDKWIYFIKNARGMEVAPAFKDPNLIEAVAIANTASMTKEELEIQDKREEFLFIQRNSIEKAKRESREEGLEEGLERGIEKGILETAITMIKEFNLSAEVVAKKLNISIDQLKKHLSE
ncbi:MAG: transposase [Epsilonproteobacteria bacterium]|nr:MAG: transposase [Campylobacterota bacterium]